MFFREGQAMEMPISVSSTSYPITVEYCTVDRYTFEVFDQTGRLLISRKESETKDVCHITDPAIKRLVIRAIPAERTPAEYALYQNHPNPFNPTSTLKYAVPTESRISLRVYNLLGQIVATLADEVEQAGYRSVEWNASSFSSGIYFYRLDATSIGNPSKTFTQVRKMMLIK